MSKNLYSNYIEREPSPRNAVYIQKWHKKLLRNYITEFGTPKSILEVGPGHGYFASECRAERIKYSYCDTSPAVTEKMTGLGFEGALGLLHDIPESFRGYDLIWMSHVLEHSPSWIDARAMVAEAHTRLAPGGRIVIVSPDVLSWRREFWNVDWSHGYPTSLRNCTQLLSDVGFQNVLGWHHRNASSNRLMRAAIALLTLVPHRAVDRVLTPARLAVGDGMAYSWKAVFGWRQVFVVGDKAVSSS